MMSFPKQLGLAHSFILLLDFWLGKKGSLLGFQVEKVQENLRISCKKAEEMKIEIQEEVIWKETRVMRVVSKMK